MAQAPVGPKQMQRVDDDMLEDLARDLLDSLDDSLDDLVDDLVDDSVDEDRSQVLVDYVHQFDIGYDGRWSLRNH